jgi:hypothetical protein
MEDDLDGEAARIRRYMDASVEHVLVVPVRSVPKRRRISVVVDGAIAAEQGFCLSSRSSRFVAISEKKPSLALKCSLKFA